VPNGYIRILPASPAALHPLHKVDGGEVLGSRSLLVIQFAESTTPGGCWPLASGTIVGLNPTGVIDRNMLPRQWDEDGRRLPSAIGEPHRTGIDCVFLTCMAEDFALFGGLLRVSGIRMHHADTVETADFLLTVTEATVLLSDPLFLDGGWEIAANMIDSYHPSVALLLTVDEGDQYFGDVAARRGVYDVITRPIRLTRLRQSIQGAHAAAQKRRAVSELV